MKRRRLGVGGLEVSAIGLGQGEFERLQTVFGGTPPKDQD
jgi:aryl-alcohol dehydrogenase-like predicted oxidoreductase